MAHIYSTSLTQTNSHNIRIRLSQRTGGCPFDLSIYIVYQFSIHVSRGLVRRLAGRVQLGRLHVRDARHRCAVPAQVHSPDGCHRRIGAGPGHSVRLVCDATPPSGLQLRYVLFDYAGTNWMCQECVCVCVHTPKRYVMMKLAPVHLVRTLQPKKRKLWTWTGIMLKLMALHRTLSHSFCFHFVASTYQMHFTYII